MTTHDQPTVTHSPDDPAFAADAPRPNDESAAMTPEPPPAAETSAPSAETAVPGGVAAETEPHRAEHETSGEELLFAGDDLAELRARWAGVQAAFVDDPKECVQQADVLVSDLVEQVTSGFAQARSHLEEQWSRGESVSTEDLRLTLMHYREFFDRLLAI